jgi:CheY-like chemotaxis protein
MSDDVIRVIDDIGPEPEPSPAWKVAVIDDDPAVHEGTRFAVYDYNLHGQGVEIISAYSAEEGRELMRTTPNIAVILLDVVMETDDAGLGWSNTFATSSRTIPSASSYAPGSPGRRPSAGSSSTTTSTTTRPRPS